MATKTHRNPMDYIVPFRASTSNEVVYANSSGNSTFLCCFKSEYEIVPMYTEAEACMFLT